MSRAVPPLQCKWNGLDLLVTRVMDRFGRAWAEHSYPGRSTSEWEDLGRKSARFTVECIFKGEDWLDRFQQFRYMVDWGGPGTFTHPYHGEFEGVVVEWSVTHVDRKKDYAEVRFDFAEGAEAPFAFSVSDTLASASAAAEAASAAARAAATGLST